MLAAYKLLEWWLRRIQLHVSSCARTWSVEAKTSYARFFISSWLSEHFDFFIDLDSLYVNWLGLKRLGHWVTHRNRSFINVTPKEVSSQLRIRLFFLTVKLFVFLFNEFASKETSLLVAEGVWNPSRIRKRLDVDINSSHESRTTTFYSLPHSRDPTWKCVL